MTPAPKRRPSSSMVVAIMALVVALAGTATAAGVPAQVAKVIKGSKIKRHSVSGNRLKNNTLTGKQIRESKLKTVPKAKLAVTANTAATATDVAAPEDYQEITTFKNGCTSGAATAPYLEAPAYYKDQEGVVHLRGVTICPAANNAAFALPEDNRPPTGKVAIFPTGITNAAAPYIIVAGTTPGVPGFTDGDVYVTQTTESLDGITFRAGS